MPLFLTLAVSFKSAPLGAENETCAIGAGTPETSVWLVPVDAKTTFLIEMYTTAPIFQHVMAPFTVIPG